MNTFDKITVISAAVGVCLFLQDVMLTYRGMSVQIIGWTIPASATCMFAAMFAFIISDDYHGPETRA